MTPHTKPSTASDASTSALLGLAWPLVLTQLAMVALGTTDTVLLGSLSASELAGGSLAIVLFNQVRTMGVGLITSLGNQVAAEAGRAESDGHVSDDRVRDLTRAGLAIATAAGIGGIAVLAGIAALLPWLGQERAVVDACRTMTAALAPGLLPCLWFLWLRQYTVGQRRPQQLLAVTLASVGLNLVLDLALLHGWGPIPTMGLAGIGLATSVVHLATAVALLAMVRRDPVLDRAFSIRLLRAPRADIVRLLRLGGPISLTYGAEAGLFTVLAVVAGWFGPAALAAHAIVNQVTYVVFQVAVGLSHGVSVLVSRAVGLRERTSARGLALRALTVAWVVTAILAVAYALAPHAVIWPFATGAGLETARVAAGLLAIAAVTQFADAAQNLGIGLLRGLDLTGAGLWMSIVGYWLVGLPTALALAVWGGLGVQGCWLGLGIGLATTASLMWWRFWRATRPGVPVGG